MFALFLNGHVNFTCSTSFPFSVTIYVEHQSCKICSSIYLSYKFLVLINLTRLPLHVHDYRERDTVRTSCPFKNKSNIYFNY